jgi:hypothetical protein
MEFFLGMNMNSVERMMANTSLPLLKDSNVAKEVAYTLRAYKRILPFHLAWTMKAAGLCHGYEPCLDTCCDFAGTLMSDGWLQYAVRPFVGKGMTMVPAYEVTERAKEILGIFNKEDKTED